VPSCWPSTLFFLSYVFLVFPTTTTPPPPPTKKRLECTREMANWNNSKTALPPGYLPLRDISWGRRSMLFLPLFSFPHLCINPEVLQNHTGTLEQPATESSYSFWGWVVVFFFCLFFWWVGKPHPPHLKDTWRGPSSTLVVPSPPCKTPCFCISSPLIIVSDYIPRFSFFFVVETR